MNTDEIDTTNSEQRQTDLTEVIDDNAVLKPLVTSRYVKKEYFDEGLKVIPVGLTKNRFGRFELNFKVNPDSEVQRVNLSSDNYNWLLQNLGTKVAEWDKPIIVTAKEYVPDSPDLSAGYTLELELA